MVIWRKCYILVCVCVCFVSWNFVLLEKMDGNGSCMTIAHFSHFYVTSLFVSWWRFQGWPGSLLQVPMVMGPHVTGILSVCSTTYWGLWQKSHQKSIFFNGPLWGKPTSDHIGFLSQSASHEESMSMACCLHGKLYSLREAWTAL